jgi:hypothetical protein
MGSEEPNDGSEPNRDAFVWRLILKLTVLNPRRAGIEGTKGLHSSHTMKIYHITGEVLSIIIHQEDTAVFFNSILGSDSCNVKYECRFDIISKGFILDVRFLTVLQN